MAVPRGITENNDLKDLASPTFEKRSNRINDLKNGLSNPLPESITCDWCESIVPAIGQSETVYMTDSPALVAPLKRLKKPVLTCVASISTADLECVAKSICFRHPTRDSACICVISNNPDFVDRTAEAFKDNMGGHYNVPGDPAEYYENDYFGWYSPIRDRIDPETTQVAEYLRKIQNNQIEVDLDDHRPQLLKPFRVNDSPDRAKTEWLYGNSYPRGLLSVTHAPGGVGKSAIVLAECLSMALGVDLLGSRVIKPQRVLYWNCEDSRKIIEDRVLALLGYHGIESSALNGRLMIRGVETPICLTESDKGRHNLSEDYNKLEKTIDISMINMVVFDPFVSLHKLPENDNGAIDMLAKGLTRLAKGKDCAIAVVAHDRKRNGSEGGYDTLRGASALADACRDMRSLNKMLPDEARAAGVSKDQVWQYVRECRDKSTLSKQSSTTPWYKLESHILMNGESVVVATKWEKPGLFDSVTEDIQGAFIERISQAPMQSNIQAKGGAVDYMLGLLQWPADEKAKRSQVDKMLRHWSTQGLLVERKIKDDSRKERPYYHILSEAD